MALVLNFKREPIDGGDFDTYHDYVMQLVRRGGEGALSCELYNNAGALYLSKGFFGLNDGTNRGTVECTTEGEIDKSLLTDNLWAAIEASVSGAAVTISITSILGANDESVIPTAIKAAYDYSKQAYMYTATKRLLGIAFIRTGNVLGRIVNCESGKLGFKNVKIIDYINESGTQSKLYIAEHKQAIGDWNMDSTSDITIYCINSSFHALVWKRLSVKNICIRNDADDKYFQQSGEGGGYLGGLTPNWQLWYITSAGVKLNRLNAGDFDSVDFNATSYNRGWVFYEYET